MPTDDGSRDPWPPERYDEDWHAFKRSRPLPTDMKVPGPGEESVWDYPRPPVIREVTSRVRVEFGGVRIAETTRALRVCETASPPCYYIPSDDVMMEHLAPSTHSTSCEWKGQAGYWTVQVGENMAQDAAWSYAEPEASFGRIRGHLAFFAGKMDACYVGEDLVTPQTGDFYGGWVTPNLVGPFKGGPRTEDW